MNTDKKEQIHFTFSIVRFLRYMALFMVWAPLYGQVEKEDKEEIKLLHSLEAGVNMGGQVSSSNLVYKTGLLLQYTANVQVSTRVLYGLGVGVHRFDQEMLLPVYANFMGFLTKEENTPYLTAKLGYAPGWKKNEYQYTDYSYKGGLLFSPGYGYKFTLKDKYPLLVSVNYTHQFVTIKYKSNSQETYFDRFNYNFLSFRVGLLL